MNRQLVIALAVWLALLALPFALRRPEPGRAAATDRLVIISAHNKAARDEYARAFGEYYYKKHGRRIELDFRTVGGTSAISRYLSDRFTAEFRAYYEKKHPGEWDDEIARAFADGKLDPDDPRVPERLRRARAEFLASNVGIGIDIMAGGGTYEHARNARNGYAVDAHVAARHPEYFAPGAIPASFGGEALYDKGGRYYGVVLSTFGISYNADRVRELGGRPPERWADLGEPRFIRTLAVADPTKSGSANKCFEIVLQQAMCEAGSPEKGWAPGLNLIKRIFANARNISDSASKVVRDVCEGDAAAGMAIDTYGISEEFWSARVFGGTPRCFYVTPRGGTAVSVDPVQLLRGAPNRRAAEEFIDFLLSVEGQRLHCFRVGAPDGPTDNSLNRPPVRRDLYTPANRRYFFKPDYDPYESGADFKYHPEWTSQYFGLLRVLFKSVAIDPHDELVEAWRAICEAGGPGKVPQAMAEFNWLPFDYAGAARAAKALKTGKPADIARLTRSWSDEARRHYRNAAGLAREGR